MNITSKKVQNQLVILIDGMIDINSAHPFYLQCEELSRQHEFNNVILDFTRMTHISAHGIQSLLTLWLFIKNNNKQLVIFQLNPKIQSIIDELSLSQKIPIYPTEQLALDHFSEEKSAKTS